MMLDVALLKDERCLDFSNFTDLDLARFRCSLHVLADFNLHLGDCLDDLPILHVVLDGLASGIGHSSVKIAIRVDLTN